MNNNGTVTLEVAGAQVSIPAATLTQLWLDKLRAGSSAPASIGSAPAIGEAWQGGIYAGLSLKDGAPVHLVLLPGTAEEVNWKDAIAWAEKAGGVLPSRHDHLVLLKNLGGEFKRDGWYWSSEERAEGSGGAWLQNFGYGSSTAATSTASAELARSARQDDAAAHADFSFEELVAAYFDCRRNKRNTFNALAFETALERNLVDLYEDLAAGTYKPGRSICFVVTRPKPREVWAANFRDRVVHHLLYNRVAPRFYRSFIADSCACIPGRGTLYAARRLEAKVRSITRNWTRPAHYLKLDLANFFVGIDKGRLQEELRHRIHEPWLQWLTDVVLLHDPRTDYEIRGTPARLALVPPHKSLLNQPAHLGLPIGNLSSQFFANVYLDVLDQHAKHQVRARHYVRYVDDFILLHDDPAWLNAAHAEIRAFLPRELGLRLNDSKTILQPIARGVDFVGHVIKPWHRTTRRKTYREALRRSAEIDDAEAFETCNSYFGLLTQATHSHHDRARLARVVMRRGRSVDAHFTKSFRPAHHQENP